jgi:hypothetical protein
MTTQRSDREIAVEAVVLLDRVLSTFTEVGSIGAIANVRRSRWQDSSHVAQWRARVDAMRAELELIPANPTPEFHERGLVHQEPQVEVLHARNGKCWQQNRCGARGGKATNDVDATCPTCRALVDAR